MSENDLRGRAQGYRTSNNRQLRETCLLERAAVYRRWIEASLIAPHCAAALLTEDARAAGCEVNVRQLLQSPSETDGKHTSRSTPASPPRRSSPIELPRDDAEADDERPYTSMAHQVPRQPLQPTAMR